MSDARWYEGDDQLLEELRVARGEDRSGEDQVELVMVGYDIVMADTVEAALVHDSAVDAMAGVRSDEAGARMLTFAAEGVEIEFELVGGRIVGHIDPPGDGVVHLEQPTSTGPAVIDATPDELGAFEFALRLPTTFRLRFVDSAGRSVATGWIDGPHETSR